MKTLNNFIVNTICCVALLVSGSAFSFTVAQKHDETCFDNITIEPGFIAFTSGRESKLADWYQKLLGLEVVKKFSFPNGSVNGVLMHKDEFIVEVFNRNNALEKSDYVKNAKPEQWNGVMKFGIYTNANLSDLKLCLNKQGINAGRIFNDNKLNIDLLQVVDPEQNILEIISRSTSG